MVAQAFSNLDSRSPEFSIGTKRVRVVNSLHLIDKKITQVNGSATYTSNWTEVEMFGRILCNAKFNESGTLYIDQSNDGYNADYSTSQVTVGGTTTNITVELCMPFVRVRWANGTANNTTTHKMFTYVRVI